MTTLLYKKDKPQSATCMNTKQLSDAELKNIIYLSITRWKYIFEFIVETKLRINLNKSEIKK